VSATISIRDQLTPALRKAAAKVQDKAPLLRAMAAAVVGTATRSFREEAMRPAAWPELAASTLKRKGGKGSLLIDTGALAQSIAAGSPQGSTVEVGTDRPYAPYLQHGTRKMPARPFMPWTEEALSPEGERAVREALEAAPQEIWRVRAGNGQRKDYLLRDYADGSRTRMFVVRRADGSVETYYPAHQDEYLEVKRKGELLWREG